MSVALVPNDTSPMTLLVENVYSCNTFTVEASGRWHWSIARTANAVGDYPGSGSPQYISPLFILPTFGFGLFLVPHGTAPPLLTVNNGVDGRPLLQSVLNGVLALTTAIGTDDYKNTFTPALIAASNPTGSGPWDVYGRICDNNLTDNIPSGPLTVTTLITGGVVPDAPTGAVASYSLNTSTCVISAHVTAATVSGADTYNALRDGVVQETLLLTPEWTDTDPVIDTAYSYTFEAVNGCGASAQSTPVVVTPITGLSTPVVTACASCCRKRIILTWTASTSSVTGATVTGYTISRDGIEIATTLPAILTYTDSDIDDLTTYTYEVVANLGDCWESPAGTVTIRMYGYEGGTLPTSTFGATACPATTFSGGTKPTNTWTNPGCGCD